MREYLGKHSANTRHSYSSKVYGRQIERQKERLREETSNLDPIPQPETYHLPCPQYCHINTCPQANYILGITPQITESLNTLLGENNPQVNLKPHISIYQRGIDHLATTLIIGANTNLPKITCMQAFEELTLLTSTLFDLFSGKIKLSFKESPFNSDTFEGYYVFEQLTQRLLINSQVRDRINSQTGNISRANTQIMIKSIEGRTDNGKAIAGDDSRLRIGLRYAHPSKGDLWTISIDSGHQLKEGIWRTVRPLSQAIEQVKVFHRLDPGDKKPYTLHYHSPKIKSADFSAARSEFIGFNETLNTIFHQFIKKRD